MAAASFTITGQDRLANKRVVKGELVLSDDYDTGGDSLDLASEVGLEQVDSFVVEGNDNAVSIDIDVSDPTEPLFLAYLYADDGNQSVVPGEAAATTDLSSLTFNVWLIGS